MKTVTTHQPIFLPWTGFFSKALKADTMVLLDDVQFPLGRSWMTRNRIKSDKGELWMSVPVWKKGRGKQIIADVEICDESDWRRKHLQSIGQQYAHAPHLPDYRARLEAIYNSRNQRLIELNVQLIRLLWEGFGLKSELVLQSELGVSGRGTDLLTAICAVMDADAFLALPQAQKYLDENVFAQNKIDLQFTRFHPPVYPQLWGDFRYNVSALDLLLTCGPKSRDILEMC